jgi:hypothetical protein
MRIKITTFCLLFVTIFFSCKKDPTMNDGSITPPAGSTAVPKLLRVLVDNKCIDEYVYTDSDMVSELKSKFDYTLNHYNSKGQVITSEYYTNDDVLSSDATVSATAISSTALVTPANGKKGGIITYDYNADGQLIKTTYNLPSSAISEYSEFSYDASNRINKQTMYWNGTATGYIDYSYDSKGNLLKEALYNMPSTGVVELVTTTSYNFDNNPNPYKLFSNLMIPGINTNANNIVKETYTIHIAPDQGTDKVQVTECSYQYNMQGYPTTKDGNIAFVYE